MSDAPVHALWLGGSIAEPLMAWCGLADGREMGDDDLIALDPEVVSCAQCLEAMGCDPTVAFETRYNGTES